MAGVLQDLMGQICLVYLDDMTFFSTKRSEHATDLCAVLDQIRAAALKLKPSKCSLLCDQTLNLGHVISAANVCPDPAKLQVLTDRPQPATVREMQSFLGVSNFYGDFILNSTELTAPLYDIPVARKGDDSI